ncbi:MAG: BrnT family toxin [Janthinobacterium lividum]
MDFDWDDSKAEANFIKHAVSFLEAASVFDDELSITFSDPDHSADEERFIIIGHSDRGRLLFVSHSDRDDQPRIISAREVTRRERKDYENVR